jgi:hypothetical protein
VRPGARPEYCATGIPLTAAPAATSWDRVWSDTATFTAPVVAVVAVVEGAEVVSVVEGAGAVEVVEAAGAVEVDDEHAAIASAAVVSATPTNPARRVRVPGAAIIRRSSRWRWTTSARR